MRRHSLYGAMALLLLMLLLLQGAFPVRGTAATNTATDAGIQKRVYAGGVYYNWDGVSNIAQFRDAEGHFCFAVDGDYDVTVYKTVNGAVSGSTVTLAKQHPLFGTALCDADGNYYLVTGEQNFTDDTSVETVFISKYSSTGQLIATTGDNGSSSLAYYYSDSFYTKVPFDAGTCDAAISGGILSVNYAREMYSGHQSNAVFSVDIATMEKVSVGVWYNSHSFAQRVVPIPGGFSYISEGDCYDRAFSIYSVRMDGNTLTESAAANIFDFWVQDGALDSSNMYVVNENFAHMGGLAPLSDGRVAFAAKSAPSLDENAAAEEEEVFIQILDPFGDLSSAAGYTTEGTRSGLAGPNGRTQVTNYGVKWLTAFSNFGYTANNIQVVSTDDDRIVVLYEFVDDHIYSGVWYIVLDSDGNIISEASCFDATARLNPCRMPVFADSKICWVGNRNGDYDYNLFVYTLDLDAEPVTGWQKENGKWRYYYADGSFATGWKRIAKQWYFFDDNGIMQTRWFQQDGEWYYLGIGGAMETGLRTINGVTYYFKPNGQMVTGWAQVDGTWYYFKASGAMAKGWLESGGKWYYMDDSGQMVTGWLTDGGKTYYMDSSGAMKTGWAQVDGTWYYFSSSGFLVTGWRSIEGSWYYFGENGVMATGWRTLDGQRYFFKASGAMAANEYCGGWWLNRNGTQTYEYQASWVQDSRGWRYVDASGWYAKNATYTIDGKAYTFDRDGYWVE
ncbi:MAG: hypothetical protein J6Z23_01925 [Lachnospiraceae bacterium]|nr:hypothetical protein [Lachnospiraceae bacterium]